MIRFWWVRHAPVQGNKNRCYGNNEVECNVNDTISFKKLVAFLPNNTYVYTSNLSRTIKTFHAAVERGFTYKDHIKDSRLNEQNLGDYTGMKYSALEDLMKEKNFSDQNWLMNSKHIPPNGESFEMLYQRVCNFIDDILLNYNYKNIVIFSHGGPIRSAINIALNNKQVSVGNFKIDNLKVTKITYDQGVWGIAFINK